MGAGFAVVLLGVIILLLIPFIYFGIRMAGYPKLAIGVGVILFLAISIPLLKLAYRGQMYSREDAMIDFNEAMIPIGNTLKIESNDISGYKSVEQHTIFIADSTKINDFIKKVEQRPDYKISPNKLNLRDEMQREDAGKIIRYYRFKDNYFVETYQKLDEYTVKTSTFALKKNNDTIKLYKLEDY